MGLFVSTNIETQIENWNLLITHIQRSSNELKSIYSTQNEWTIRKFLKFPFEIKRFNGLIRTHRKQIQIENIVSRLFIQTILWHIPFLTFYDDSKIIQDFALDYVVWQYMCSVCS